MKLPVLLLFTPLLAFAGGAENMVAQCEAVMRCDVCRIEKDTSPATGLKLITYRDDAGVPHARYVSGRAYEFIRNAGDEKSGDRYLMCVRVEQAMKDPDSDEAVVARLSFRADWKPMKYCP